MPSTMSREAVINMTLRHMNIVIMMGAVFDEENQGFVLEYVEFGCFTDFLDKTKDENGLYKLKPFRIVNIILIKTVTSVAKKE